MPLKAIGSILLCTLLSARSTIAQPETRVVIEHDGWQLVGDLVIPDSGTPLPAVLMLNQAAGDRTVYEDLARHLADRRIASLRLDLPGHGESINQGRFVPGEQTRSPMIWDAETSVIAAHEYLKADTRLDPQRIGMVGASYSGEEMAEAGRMYGYAQAYVALSPGSFSEASIASIDTGETPWLFVAAKRERYLQEITAAVQQTSETVELLIVPGTEHATRLLTARPDLSERIAVWFSHVL